MQPTNGKLILTVLESGGVTLRYQRASDSRRSMESVLFGDRGRASEKLAAAGLQTEAKQAETAAKGEVAFPVDLTDELLNTLGFNKTGAKLY